MKNIRLLLFVLLLYANVHSQNKNMNTYIEDLKLKGKANAIKLAYTLIEEKQPGIIINPKDFEIKVLANSKEIVVQFRRIIRYVPLRFQAKNQIKYDITVNLIQNMISPFDDILESTFYIPTDKDLEAIAFVQKNFGIFSPDFETTVYEEDDYYAIHMENQYSYGRYKINKKTGEEEPSIQGSYLPIAKTLFSPEADVLLEINH